jgi:3-dehydroquinate dehydratase-2
MLGVRERGIYGSETYEDLLKYVREVCVENDIEPTFFQSNHEGAIVDAIQEAYGRYDGIVINPAAYTHTSIAILDALKAVSIPAVEVHLSDIFSREPFRHVSYPGIACVKSYVGMGFEGYKRAVLFLKQYCDGSNSHFS